MHGPKQLGGSKSFDDILAYYKTPRKNEGRIRKDERVHLDVRVIADNDLNENYNDRLSLF